MRIIIIAYIILAFSVCFGQEDNWGPADTIGLYTWHDSCFNLYGYGSPAIVANDSTLLLMHWCPVGFRLAYSRYIENEWQNPIDLGYEGDNPFIQIGQDTVVFFNCHLPSGFGQQDICTGKFHDGQLDSIQSLGPPVNTDADESSPSLTNDGFRLYFLRGQDIMYSDIVNGQYSEPIALPPIINSSNLMELFPRIYPDGSKLYFNRSYGIIAPCIMFVGHFENGVWQEPLRLNSNINYWDPVPPEDNYGYGCSPSFSGDYRKMYFSHIGFAGGEIGSGIMMSELVMDIESRQVNIPSSLEISAWPNPFNDQVVISLDGNLGNLIEAGIYNIIGQKIKSLPLSNRLLWDGCNSEGSQIGSGIYFIKAVSKKYSVSLKLTLIR
jgi:hypothetical protein